MKKIPFAVVKMVNIVLLMIPFLICWTLYYEPRTTTVGSKQVSVLVMIIFFLICYYFGQRLDCFRVSILQIRDVIFGEVLATMITDIIMYILIWMLSIHLPNLIPGLITWGGQCVIGVIWACLVKEDSYFLQTSRYIHLNPVKARIVVKPEDYRWSSYQTMIALKDDRITERNRTLAYFKDNSILRYRDFVEDIGHKYVVQEHEIKKSMEELPFD